MEALLQLKGIDKAFPGVKALSGAALNVYPGRVMALVGENGAGKSTMMKVLTGIYTRDAGTLLWLGKETTFTGPKSSQEAGIGIIHQELNLIPQLTIAENIFLGREFVNRFGKIDWKTMYAEADKLLAKLNLRFKSDKLVGDLSIGDQQMVEIAKVLSFESKVIIMDEPTDALTDTETESLFRVIRELKSQGRGIVYISHRMKEIFEICDDVTVFRDGQFIAEREVASLTEDSLIEMMVGRKLEDQYPHLDKAPGDIRLKVDNLCGPGVNDVSFTLRKGEILGVSGLMGAGRTELMKVLYGALPRTSGYVTLDGHEVVTRSPQDGLANGIVYISEDRKRDGLVLGMSVKENMSLTALRYFSRAGGSLKHADEQQAVSDFIRLFNVKTPSMEQAIGLLSGGNQQKVAIARGLMTRPKVLILDEPTRGVDVGAKKEIYQLINQFKADGLSIILVSSEMPEVLGMSDRIIVMHEGHLSGEFTREQATQEVLMAAAVGKLNRVNQSKKMTTQTVSGRRYFTKAWLMEQKSLIALLVLIAIVSTLSPNFFTINNLFNILQQTSVNAIMAVGMTLVILTSGIDLSVGSLLALTGAVAASIVGIEVNALVAVAAALALGAAIGAVTGVIVAKGRVQAFIATLVMMLLLRGVTMVYTNGSPVNTGFTENADLFGWFGIGRPLGVPTPVWIMGIVFLAAWYMLHHTRLGRYIYALGGNEAATRLSGINVNKIKIIVYSLCGLLASLAGIIEVARLSSAQPTAGTGYELDAIAAVVLGGTSLAGGKGRIVGTLIGALILGFLNNGLNLLGVSSYYQMIVKAVVILLAVLVDNKKQ